jgi:hypothetical protein
MVGGGLEPGVQKVPKAGEFSISRKVWFIILTSPFQEHSFMLFVQEFFLMDIPICLTSISFNYVTGTVLSYECK